MVQVSAEEATKKLPQLIAAAINGESVFIKEDEDHIVQLIPVAGGNHDRIPGSARGMVWIDDDFDAPLEDFKEYIP